MKQTNRIGIAKIIISTKEYLAAISVDKNALVVYTLHYSDEMRKLNELDIPSEDTKKYKVTTKEIEIAKKLIQSMAAKWKPDLYHDEYKLVVERWFEEKAKKLPPTKMQRCAHSTEKDKVINFVDLLRKSLEKPTKATKKTKLKKITSVKKHQASRHVTKH